MISGFEKPPFLLEYLEGLPVAYHFYKDEEHQMQLMGDILRNLFSEKLPYNELVILSPKKFESTCLKSFSVHQIKEIKTINEISGTQNFCCFATIQSFKGLESNYVLITDIEELSSELSKSLMYVGMSRARYGLILLISESKHNQYNEILKNKFR